MNRNNDKIPKCKNYYEAASQFWNYIYKHHNFSTVDIDLS